MGVRPWFRFIVLATAMLLASAGAQSGLSTSLAKKGGTLNIELTTDIDYADPSLSYYVPSWEIQYATALKLVNYPDAEGAKGRRLVPEAATSFPTVSNGGKKYTFTIRPGLRLANGQKVTARNFAFAINRAASREMQSQAQPFLADIVGAEDVFGGKAKTISGVRANGMKLTITLTKPAPDFLLRIATPFFQAIPLNLPLDPNGVHSVFSGGPYYIASYTPNRQIVVKRNTFYKGKRPQNVDQFVYSVGKSLAAIQLEVDRGNADYAADGIPPGAWAGIAKKYGVVKKPGKEGRFQLRSTLTTSYLAMNTTYGSARPATSQPLQISSIQARFVQANRETTYSIPTVKAAPGAKISYRWTLTLQAVDPNVGVDPGCNNHGRLGGTDPTFVWQHGNIGDPVRDDGCDHTKQGRYGHQGLIRVVVSDNLGRECVATYKGTESSDANSVTNGIASAPVCSGGAREPLFKNNAKLRRAVNYAIDRRALLAQSGFAAGARSDQILPPGMPGFRNANIYPLNGPNLTMARRLARGNTRDGKLVLYTSNRGASVLRAQIYQLDLKQIGLDVDVKLFPRDVLIQKIGTPGEPFDAVDVDGWDPGYADPFDFINVLLYGGFIHEENNNNFSYFNNPTFNKRMEKAALLFGAARYRAYGQLDIDISRQQAPWAAVGGGTDRVFLSSHFGCFVFNPVMGVDLAAACRK